MLLIEVVDEGFRLEEAVCNHGFFMMAPNRWIPSKKCLIRPLTLHHRHTNINPPCDQYSSSFVTVTVTVSITQPQYAPKLLHIKPLMPQDHHHHHHITKLSDEDKQEIGDQVKRMLRISERDQKSVSEFQRVNLEAKERGFGRIFRAPTLFEDMVKSVLLCNTTWRRSLEMAQALCDLQHTSKLSNCNSCNHSRSKKTKLKKKKRKRSSLSSSCSTSITTDHDDQEYYCRGNFPTPGELVAIAMDAETLKKKCNLGYRASIILDLARSIETGTLRLSKFEQAPEVEEEVEEEEEEDRLFHRLTKIKGFGPFVVANIMMCIGYYHRIPVDSETAKHLQQVHGIEMARQETERTKSVKIAQVYDKHAPFQCLVYWMEHLQYYEKMLGMRLSQLPQSHYSNVATTQLVKG